MVKNELAEEFIRDYCLYLRNEVGLTQSSVWIYSILLKQAYYNEQHRKLSEFADFIKRYFPYAEKLMPIINFLRNKLNFNKDYAHSRMSP